MDLGQLFDFYRYFVKEKGFNAGRNPLKNEGDHLRRSASEES